VISRSLLSILVATSWLPQVAAQQALPSLSNSAASPREEQTQDFGEAVVPITSVKFTPKIKMSRVGKLGPKLDLSINFGTGFCLDLSCRLIATNYHVAVTTRARHIKGEKIVERYFATGPHDAGATVNIFPNGGAFPYAMSRDLALFELRRPLPQHHGLSFSLKELEVGQEVDIYSYPMGTINPVRKLVRFPAKFKASTTSGLLAFEYQLSSDKPIHIQGASGGIVVDKRSERVVGVLNATTETMALAVPIQNLVDFVTKVLPFEAEKIFPAAQGVSAFSPDFYPKFVPAPDFYSKFAPLGGDGLKHRPEEPSEVGELRQRAQTLADSMRNFIALQSYAWGSGEEEPKTEAVYEVRMIDGDQRFSRYPEGKHELDEVPPPHLTGWVLPADAWSQLPKMVGTELRLKVQQDTDVTWGGRQMKVFKYYASIEDKLCPFKPVEDFGIFRIAKTVSVECYGEVWTDQDTNILRISEHLDLSKKLKAYRGWEDFQVVITYGWLSRGDEIPKRVPLTIFTQARYKTKLYWCRGLFTNYRVFSATARLITK
jgi:hypothetical protein